MNKKVLLIGFYYPNQIGIRVVGSLLKKKYSINYLFFIDYPKNFFFDNEWIKKKVNYDKLKRFMNCYDYILISSSHFEIELTFFIADMIKKINSLKPVIIGGSLGIQKTEECLNYADYVCCWTPQTIIDFFEYLEGGKLENNTLVNFKGRDKSIKTILKSPKNYDELPLPDFSDNKEYFYTKGHIFKKEKNYKYDYLICPTSSGCFFNCSFCHNSIERKIRKNNQQKLVERSSIKFIFKRLNQLKKLSSNKATIFIPDANFFIYSLEELKLFVKFYNKKINIPLSINADPRTLNIIKKFKIISEIKTNVNFNLGVQTGSEDLNKRVYNRIQTNEQILKLNNNLTRLKTNVIINYYFIYANPLETKEDVIKTINLMLKLKKSKFQLDSYTPIPLTKLGEKVKKYYSKKHHFFYPKYSIFEKHGFYYFLMFLINRINSHNFDFILPKKINQNFFTEFMNSKLFSKLFYIYFTSKMEHLFSNVQKNIEKKVKKTSSLIFK